MYIMDYPVSKPVKTVEGNLPSPLICVRRNAFIASDGELNAFR